MSCADRGGGSILNLQSKINKNISRAPPPQGKLKYPPSPPPTPEIFFDPSINVEDAETYLKC